MVSVKVESNENMSQRVLARSHTFLVDEPGTLGGDDSGPTPYELLLASLAT